jgi:hypothetical protein
MIDIVDIVEGQIVNKINNQLTVNSFVGGVITVCDLKWARVNKTLTDSASNDYLIQSIDDETKEITLTTAYIGTIGTVYLEIPLYVHGTPKTTNIEWTKLTNNELAKVPFIWLVEPVSERVFGNDSSVERESELRVLFCDNRDGAQWTNGDIHAERSKTLYEMIEAFVEAIQKNPIFKRYTDFSTRNLTKLGTENAQGFEKNVIDAELTAIELRLTLPIYKVSNCKC